MFGKYIAVKRTEYFIDWHFTLKTTNQLPVNATPLFQRRAAKSKNVQNAHPFNLSMQHPFLTQGSEEQKCTKRASVQPLVYLRLYVYRYVWQIYSCKEDRILYRLTFHLKTTNQLPVNATPLFQRRAAKSKHVQNVHPFNLWSIYIYTYIDMSHKYIAVKRTEYFIDWHFT